MWPVPAAIFVFVKVLVEFASVHTLEFLKIKVSNCRAFPSAYAAIEVTDEVSIF